MYQRLCARLNSPSRPTPPATVLQQVFRETFGKGLDLDVVPPFDGHYDGSTELESGPFASCSSSLLQPTPAALRTVGPGEMPVLAESADSLADDVLIFLIGYREHMPVTALTRSLMALVSLELFTYTVKLAFAVDELVRTRTLPNAMKGSPEAYRPPRSMSTSLASGRGLATALRGRALLGICKSCEPSMAIWCG